MSSSNYKHMPVLDGLRAFAIIFVLLRHGFILINGYDYDSLPYSLESFMINGLVGVDLFFVLSGFLIVHQLLNKYKLLSDCLGFYKNRFLRIAPAYYAVLILTIVGFFPFYQFNSDDFEYSFFYHLLWMQDITSSDIAVTFWSLGVEIKYYLIAPFIIYLSTKLRTSFSIILLCVFIFIIVLGRYYHSVEFNYSYNDYFLNLRSPFYHSLDGLIMGAICALLYNNKKCKELFDKTILRHVFFVFGFIIVFLYMGAGNHYIDMNYYQITFYPLIISLGFSLCLLGLVNNSFLSNLFSLKLFFPIALISYSLYLVHWQVRPLAFHLSEILGIGGNSDFWIMYLLLSLIVALGVYFLFERPFLSYKRKLNKE